jgi:hypothetical protein
MSNTRQWKVKGNYSTMTFKMKMMMILKITTQYDIDYPANSIQAFATHFCNRPPLRSTAAKIKISADKRHSLDDKRKNIWNCLDDKATAIILGYQNDHQTTSNHQSPFVQHSILQKTSMYKPPMKAQSNLRELLAPDFLLANMHDVHVNQDEYHECNQETSIDTTSDNEIEILLIKGALSLSNGNTPHATPGDIHQVMSKSLKRSVLSVNLNLSEYKVYFHKAAFGWNLSLLDRGVNGGVAGDDVRIIFRTYQTFDIKVIDIIT